MKRNKSKAKKTPKKPKIPTWTITPARDCRLIERLASGTGYVIKNVWHDRERNSKKR